MGAPFILPSTPIPTPFSTGVGGTGNTAGDLSGLSVQVAGGQARALSLMLGDAVNILNILPQASATTDFTSAIIALLAAGKRVYFPNTGTLYQISGQIVLPAGATLIFEPGAGVKQVGTPSYSFVTAGPNVRIRDLFFQGVSLNANPILVQSDDFSWIGGGVDTAGSIRVNPCNRATFDRMKVTNAGNPGFYLFGSTGTRITNTEIQNCTGLGIYAVNGASDYYLCGNWTDGNAFELLGVDYSCHDGIIIGNRAKYTGDNGISVSGNKNVVFGNRCTFCCYTGVAIYGSYNTVSGNIGLNNGQVRNPASAFYNASNAGGHSGIGVIPGFGGAAAHNTVVGNYGDDDQSTMTQAYGVAVYSQYPNWTASTSFAAGVIVFSGGRLYRYATAGTSSTTAPTHTSGTVADGTATLTYLATTPDNTREPSSNLLGPNHVNRALIAPTFNGTTNSNNFIITDSSINLNGTTLTGGTATSPTEASFIPVGLRTKVSPVWTSGMSVFYGRLVYTGNYYRALNAGTSTVQPTHSSGTVTGSDGVTWLYLGAGRFSPALSLPNSARPAFPNGFDLGIGESTTNVVNFYAGTGSPEGKVTATVGSIYLRSDGAAGSTLYVKESGTGPTGWTAK